MPLHAESAVGTAHGSLAVAIDGAVVRVTGTGFWSNAEVDAHFRELRRLVGAARLRHARLDVLVDLRGSAVQAREITERIERETRAIWTPDDRIAMVLRPGLARMQMSRVIDGQNHRTFDDLGDARAWLDRG